MLVFQHSSENNYLEMEKLIPMLQTKHKYRCRPPTTMQKTITTSEKHQPVILGNNKANGMESAPVLRHHTHIY